MAEEDHIRNPLEWGWDQVKQATHVVREAGHHVRRSEEERSAPLPAVRRIEVADLKDVLVKGFDDFGSYRTDVIFLCIIYPIVGIVLARMAFGDDMLPMVFPLASGFALIGPVAAVGLYEMSRQHELGLEPSWAAAFSVVRSPAFGALFLLGLILFAIFLLWLFVAYEIYQATLGPEPPSAIGPFISDVFTTGAGWAMIVVGCGVGFLFALLVLAISVVSFPLLLDRDVGIYTAVETSVRSVIVNPRPMAIWGLIVAGGLVIGSIPLFLGLIVVLPVLGHATWHLYRKVLPR